MISAVALASALYSTSVLDPDSVGCFRALHDTRFEPKNMVNPLVDLLSSKHPTKSASKKLLTNKDGDFTM
jgi:hypothetical protein